MAYIAEFDEFCANPSDKTLIKFGRAIVQSELPLSDKRMMFSELFEIPFGDSLEAGINLWSYALILEDPSIPLENTLAGISHALHEKNISNEMVRQWLEAILSANRIPKKIRQQIVEMVKKSRGDLLG